LNNIAFHLLQAMMGENGTLVQDNGNVLDDKGEPIVNLHGAHLSWGLLSYTVTQSPGSPMEAHKPLRVNLFPLLRQTCEQR